jgi:hypothetical protein
MLGIVYTLIVLWVFAAILDRIIGKPPNSP